MFYKCKKNNSSLKRKVTYKKYVTNFKTERLALIESHDEIHTTLKFATGRKFQFPASL